jgi:hypothetical protein
MSKKEKAEKIEDMVVRQNPSLHLDGDDALEGCTLGDTVTMMVKAKLVGHNLDTSGEKEWSNQRFEIIEIKRDGGNKQAEKAQKRGRGIMGYED